MGNGSNSVINAGLWSIVERLSSEIVSFAIGIILARLLSPHEYGVIGIVAIFIAFSNIIVEAGFTNALIRKTDRSNSELSTAFLFNFGISLVVYALLWFASPLIAQFFKDDYLEILVKIIGVNVILNSLCIVQTAILTANLKIRTQTIISLFSQIPSGIAAIIFAYSGYGIFALVIQIVGACLIKTVLLWVCTSWFPTLNFDRQALNYLWGFGSKLITATFIGTCFSQIYSILIGKYIGKSELGLYSKCNGLANHVNTISIGVIQKIAIPILSHFQNDSIRLRCQFTEMMRLLLLLIAPLTAFIFFESENIILLIWSEKWIEGVPMLKLLMIGLVWEPISSLSLCLLQVVNRTDIILKLEFPKKTFCLFVIVIGFCFGIYGLLIGRIITNLFAAIVNMIPTKRLLNYTFISQLKDLLRYILVSYGLGTILLFIKVPSLIGTVLLGFFIYSIFYITSLFILKDSTFMKYYQKGYDYFHN